MRDGRALFLFSSLTLKITLFLSLSTDFYTHTSHHITYSYTFTNTHTQKHIAPNNPMCMGTFDAVRATRNT